MPQLPWQQPGWMTAVREWIDRQLAEQNIGLDGSIEPIHDRPWSTIWRMPTTLGRLYFKATTPVLAHEPALTQALSRWQSDCSPVVWASDLDNGWLLMADAGDTLRSQIQPIGDFRPWLEIMPRYARLQIELASRRDALLAMGVLDRRLSGLPAQYERLLSDWETLQAGGLTAAEYQQLVAGVPQFADKCTRLAKFGLPETLHHDDFHDANIFVREGRYTFADWGESGIAPPFFTLLVTLRSIAYSLKLADDAPELNQIRDAYLSEWRDFSSPADLLEAAEVAQRIAMVARALTWYRLVAGLEEPDRTEYIDSVAGWLQEYLSAD